MPALHIYLRVRWISPSEAESESSQDLISSNEAHLSPHYDLQIVQCEIQSSYTTPDAEWHLNYPLAKISYTWFTDNKPLPSKKHGRADEKKMSEHNEATQHIWKLGSLCTFTAQPIFIFSIVIAETLTTTSTAIAGFSCLAAQS